MGLGMHARLCSRRAFEACVGVKGKMGFMSPVSFSVSLARGQKRAIKLD